MSFLDKWFSDWQNRELEELKLDEGLRLKSYQDTEGVWTVGYGHTGPDVRQGLEISKEKAGEYLDEDWDEAVVLAKQLCKSFDKLNGARKGVLVNMAFNLGSRLGQFKKFLAAIEDQDYSLAAKEMLDSKWSTQVGKRANRLAYRMATSAYSVRV